MTNASAFLDSLVTEYLTFRGFAASAVQFNNDVKTDKDRGFNVERIVEELVNNVGRYDLPRVHALWTHLNERIFLQLTKVQSNHATKLENDLYKLYLANCVQNGKKEKISEFFELLGAALHVREGWADWFAISYITNPRDQDPYRLYFSKSWQQTYFVCLHNFLSIAFHQCDLPVLYACITPGETPRNDQQDKETVAKLSSALLRLRAPTDDFSAGDYTDDFASIANVNSGDAKSKSLGSRIRQKLRGNKN